METKHWKSLCVVSSKYEKIELVIEDICGIIFQDGEQREQREQRDFVRQFAKHAVYASGCESGVLYAAMRRGQYHELAA